MYPPKPTDLVARNAPSEMNMSLPESRRKKLVDIQKREQLKDVLITQFKNKYHMRNMTGPVVEGVINTQVGNFIDSANISRNNLNRLEQKIKKDVQKQHPEGDKLTVVSAVSDYSVHTKRSGMSKVSDLTMLKGAYARANKLPGAPPPPPEATADGDASPLGGLAVTGTEAELHPSGSTALPGDTTKPKRQSTEELIQQLGHCNEDEREKKRVQEEKSMLRTELDQQVQEKMNKKVLLKQDEMDFFRLQQEEARIWQSEADKVQREQDKQFVQRVLEEKAAEERRQVKKKEKQARLNQKIKEENAKEREIKDAKKREETAADLQALAEYNRILDAQEKQREAELQARLERQKALMEKMANTVGKLQEERMREKTQSFIRSQMEEKDLEKKRVRQLQTLHGALLEEDSREFQDKERKRGRERQLRLLRYRQELEAQIEENKKRSALQMSPEEMRMNKELLELIDRTFSEIGSIVNSPPQTTLTANRPEMDDDE
uniref:Trichohyalin-plectin-homology domain-containing protein n=1 Tax=Chromera velia CCMP2878 TaxID=1169474 RepID=A0A0G4HTH6_9ALVE|eukprot:Cvel_1339.t1-p1 / transcript=Cvel_1339.t1 / gene=Cvel_1339 / organism=Chromera_velia_CCMP2878 / gene_product=Inner centromere protein B, putative / transcript_product=Inner centromere protein B, putative / location=Cvel_scaffold46:13501-19886(+) / protein_length=491 / sequence_SO=supercontig / SO=protein_coding / is_pseudo=false